MFRGGEVTSKIHFNANFLIFFNIVLMIVVGLKMLVMAFSTYFYELKTKFIPKKTPKKYL